MKSVMNSFKIYLTIATIILIIGCGKQTENPAQFMTHDFPLKVGNKWVYQVSYNSISYLDTETVSIVNMQTLPNDSVVYTINVSIKNSSNISTQYISVKGDKIVYNSIYEDSPPFGFMLLKLPCKQGDYWTGGSPHDTTRVVSLTTTQLVNGQNYSNVYFLRRTAFSNGFNDLETYQLSPNVGLLQYNVNIFDSGSGIFRNTSSTLINYQIL